ncbi:MAG: PEP-CTERM sorting domain-containing protein [Verrucomicrobiales bacterium]
MSVKSPSLGNRSSQLGPFSLFMGGRKLVALVGLIGCVAIPVRAGVWSEAPLVASPAAAADASSGISASKIYTHAVDWATDDGGAVVNGVTLGEGSAVGSNYTLTGTNFVFQNNPSNTFDSASGMFDLNDDFLFTGQQSPIQTLTLSGLTGGTPYIMTTYLSQGWNGAQQILSADDPGFTTLTTDRGEPGNPKMISYSYMLDPGDTDVVFTFDAVNDADGFHHYAFTNEVVPEPMGLGLLAMGAIGLVARRRRG